MSEKTEDLEIKKLKEKAELADERHKKMEAAVEKYPSEDELPSGVLDQWAKLDRSDHRKKKILVLYYGGTLGMHTEIVGGKEILRPTNDAYELLEPLRGKGLEERMQVVWFPVWKEAIDSTNGRWPHWVSIANAIELLYDKYDGFVVAGGTDTMAYLMAAMHFIFPNIGKPIIGAAAQQPMRGWGDDATRNLAFSMQAACEDISGAHLAFYDILRDGRHIFKIQDRAYNAFDSPPQHILGHFSQGEVVLHGNQPRREPTINKRRLIVDKNFRDGVMQTGMTPFTYAESLSHMAEDPYTYAVLLTTYGAGNVRNMKMAGDEKTYVDVLSQLHRKRFPVVLGSPMQDGVVDSPYEPGIEAIDAGAVSGGDTTGATLLVKMSRALHNAWFTPERREKAQRIAKEAIGRDAMGGSTMGIFTDYASRLYGVDYDEFRRQMYRSHVGELTVPIHDRMPPSYTSKFYADPKWH